MPITRRRRRRRCGRRPHRGPGGPRTTSGASAGQRGQVAGGQIRPDQHQAFAPIIDEGAQRACLVTVRRDGAEDDVVAQFVRRDVNAVDEFGVELS